MASEQREQTEEKVQREQQRGARRCEQREVRLAGVSDEQRRQAEGDGRVQRPTAGIWRLLRFLVASEDRSLVDIVGMKLANALSLLGLGPAGDRPRPHARPPPPLEIVSIACESSEARAGFRFRGDRRGGHVSAPARHDKSDPMYLRFAKEFESIDREEKDFYHSANRFIIKRSCAYFGLLDSHRTNSEECAGASGDAERPPAPPVRADNERALNNLTWKRRSFVALLLLAYLMIVTPYLLVVMYHQYRYDLDSIRLQNLQSPPAPDTLETASHGGVSPRALSVSPMFTLIKVTRMKARIARTRAILEFLDADFSHTPILTECRYLICIARICIFVSFLVFNRLKGTFDYHIVRDLLDRHRRNKHLWSMAERQAVSYLESNRVHTENSGALIRSVTYQRLQEARYQRRMGSLAHDGAAAASQGQLLNQRMVLEMLSSGALLPLHKMPVWTQKRAKYQFIYHLIFGFSMLLFDASFVYGFFLFEKTTASQPPGAEQSAARQAGGSSSLAKAACVSMLIVSNPTGLIHPPLFLIVVHEKIKHIEQLCCLIKQCVYVNSKLFYLHIARQFRSSSSRHARIINSNVIFTLLHYKIFKAELKPLKSSLGFINFIALLMLLWTPIVARLHQPYLEKANVGDEARAQAKYLLVTVSASVLLPVIMVTVPLCLMQARCKQMYKCLASLAAHIAEVRSHQSGSSAYDKHAENCLLREICDPHIFVQLTTASFGPVHASYACLIKVLLWYFLFMISLLFNRIAGIQGTLEWLFDDPLRAFTHS